MTRFIAAPIVTLAAVAALAAASVAAPPDAATAPPAAAAQATKPADSIVFDVPVQLTAITAHSVGKPPRVDVICGAATGDSLEIAPGVTSNAGGGMRSRFSPGRQSTGAAGMMVGEETTHVPVDAKGSYSGPPIHVVVKPVAKTPVGSAHSYLCAVLFNGAVPTNAVRGGSPSGTGGGNGSSTYPYDPSSFHPTSEGKIQ